MWWIYNSTWYDIFEYVWFDDRRGKRWTNRLISEDLLPFHYGKLITKITLLPSPTKWKSFPKQRIGNYACGKWFTLSLVSTNDSLDRWAWSSFKKVTLIHGTDSVKDFVVLDRVITFIEIIQNFAAFLLCRCETVSPLAETPLCEIV